MACHWLLALLWFGLGWGAHAHVISDGSVRAAESAPSPDVYDVKRGLQDVNLRAYTWEWIDPTGAATLAQVLEAEQKGGAGFLASSTLSPIKDLRGKATLWLRVRLAYAPNADVDHALFVPLPYIDEVNFFVREPSGSWSSHVAGDTVSITKWPERTRFPVLRLHPTPGQERLIYIRVNQGTRTSIPLMLDESPHFNWDERFDMLVFGGVTGGLALLTLVCLLQGVVFRDLDFVRLASFCLLMTLGLATYTGVTPLVVGGRTELWADASQALMFCLIAASGLYLARLVLQGSSVRPLFLRIALVAAWAGVPLAGFVTVADRPLVASVIGAYVAITSLVASWACFAAWKAKARAALWLMLAFLPMVGAVGVLSARLHGLDMPLWLATHALTIGTAMHLPLLVIAMNMRSRDKHMSHARSLALETQDALTGLLAGHLFEDRVARAVAAPGRTRGGALVLFRISNFAQLRTGLGVTASDKLLLRASVRMRKALYNAENLARLGDGDFGVLYESANDRAAIQEACARLVAAGLMPLPGLPKGLSLNYQCVVMMLGENRLAAADCLALVRHRLSMMSSRTRRPIRFIESAPSDGSDADEAAHSSREFNSEPGGKPQLNLVRLDRAVAHRSTQTPLQNVAQGGVPNGQGSLTLVNADTTP